MELIALRTVRYNDRHSILSAFTEARGRVSLLVPAGNGKEARRRRALLMPLSVSDCEIDFRPGREIFNISDVRPVYPAVNIASSPVRSIQALFLADFLNSLLRESQADPILFGFLKEMAAALELLPADMLANFHLVTLARLTRFVGIGPDFATYRRGHVFDLQDGLWRTTPPLHSRWLEAGDARVAFILCHLGWHSLRRLRLSRDGRNRALDFMLDYYEGHFSKLTLPSLAVLRDFT